MNNLVQISKNNQLTTDSPTLAKVFGKRHSDIISTIESLEIPDDFRVRNFPQSKFQTSNRNGMSYKKYEITRDGFTLLAMGFTGAKAMKFKIDYINAFNAMEHTMLKQAQHDRNSGLVGRLLGNFELRKENQSQKVLIADLSKNLLKTKPRWQKIIHYMNIGLNQTEIAAILHIGRSTVKYYLKQMRDLNIIDYKNNVTTRQQLTFNFSNEE